MVVCLVLKRHYTISSEVREQCRGYGIKNVSAGSQREGLPNATYWATSSQFKHTSNNWKWLHPVYTKVNSLTAKHGWMRGWGAGLIFSAKLFTTRKHSHAFSCIPKWWPHHIPTDSPNLIVTQMVLAKLNWSQTKTKHHECGSGTGM